MKKTVFFIMLVSAFSSYANVLHDDLKKEVSMFELAKCILGFAPNIVAENQTDLKALAEEKFPVGKSVTGELSQILKRIGAQILPGNQRIGVQKIRGRYQLHFDKIIVDINNDRSLLTLQMAIFIDERGDAKSVVITESSDAWYGRAVF